MSLGEKTGVTFDDGDTIDGDGDSIYDSLNLSFAVNFLDKNVIFNSKTTFSCFEDIFEDFSYYTQRWLFRGKSPKFLLKILLC